MPELPFFLIAGAAVLLGSAVQTGVGLGLGLVAAPVLVVLEPSLMPGTLLVTTVTMPLLTVCAERRHIDWHGLSWGLPARMPGAVAGAWLITVADPRLLGALVGLMVLAAVAASAFSRGGADRPGAPGRPGTQGGPDGVDRVDPADGADPVESRGSDGPPRAHRFSPAALLTAGAAAGLTGTATSIGGPPLALLYQRQPAARVRATLGGFFLGGTLISVLTLAAAGELTAHQVSTGLLLVPFVVAGFAAGRPLCRRLGEARLRTAMLTVVSLSGATLLIRSLL
ncbi:sulfite exporter TauE/SafE family protein [Streptomyces armeniacus]|uniref:Probable membrane transporter protein n=1 Tax=Streptomyces armeniacus TaxID=83291 RepID=A0A345XKY7_9ACTN|nr:sulfite exporter TauE/SafE family protein [Streptomyces armeniacus]AXK32303.1 sulfite exporter TauE/SafE family protein [Streptomyces armeniacus]